MSSNNNNNTSAHQSENVLYVCVRGPTLTTICDTSPVTENNSVQISERERSAVLASVLKFCKDNNMSLPELSAVAPRPLYL